MNFNGILWDYNFVGRYIESAIPNFRNWMIEDSWSAILKTPFYQFLSKKFEFFQNFSKPQSLKKNFQSLKEKDVWKFSITLITI